MTDRSKNPRTPASTRRALFGASAAALAAGGILSERWSALAQDDTSAAEQSQEATPPVASGYLVANVKEFGAVGDYDTDDTAAIQAAVESLGSDGGIVFLPNGEYSITSAITLSSSIELIGESLNSLIQARTSDAAIKVANTEVVNEDIYLRRLNIRNDDSTPIGVDARYMLGCGIEDCVIQDFAQYGIHYGGNTSSNNAAWSNVVAGTVIRSSPTCIYLYGVHSEGGSPANWITIRDCAIFPDDTSSSIGVDLANGDTVRLINNDIGYSPNATAIMIRKHVYGQLEYNRFEDIGEVEPAHPIEKEYGVSNFQITGMPVNVYYQRAEFLEITGEPTGGTFTLTRGAATTSDIAYSTDKETLAGDIQSALEQLAAIGPGDVEVTDVSETRLRVAWLNGQGHSDRPNLTADASGLTGENEPGITVVQGSFADAIRQSGDVVVAAVENDTEMASVTELGPHLDLAKPLVTRQPLVAIDPGGAMAIRLQRDDENYPRMGLSTTGRIVWANGESGEPYGGLGLRPDSSEQPAIGWDDDLNVTLPRHTIDEGDAAVNSSYRGSLYRIEGEPGTRDHLCYGMKESDDQTYTRHLYPGFTARADLEFPSIDSGSVAEITMTATGARVGDAVLVTPPQGLEAGLVPNGFVSDTDTVSIRVFNGSDDDLTPATATWIVLVLQP
jgi:hypothetical protein